MSEALLYQQDGHVVTLTLNRPEARNALSGAEGAELWEPAAARINADKEVRCVIVTGAGKAFSAGGDLKGMRERTMFTPGGTNIRESYRRGVHRVVRALWGIEVPVIAAVNGPAIGLGCDLTCLCDMRIAGESAAFGVTFLKVGLVPGDGGAWLLPRVIGYARAAELFFTGDVLDAAAAREAGLVSRVVPDARLMEEARALAAKVCALPPDVVRMTKRLMREGMTNSFDAILEMSATMQALAHETEDHREALDAFFEKRAPVFKGR